MESLTEFSDSVETLKKHLNNCAQWRAANLRKAERDESDDLFVVERDKDIQHLLAEINRRRHESYRKV